MKAYRMKQRFFLIYSVVFLIALSICSCSPQQKISQSARREIINAPVLQNANVGISLLDASTGKYIYNYQAEKYFIPASNTKIPTCYAAMKYLGDSLVSFQYAENDTAIIIYPGADPTLLHPDFSRQPGITFLRNSSKPLYVTAQQWKDNAYGNGWVWDEYNESYMAERSALPVYGNIITWHQVQTTDDLSGDSSMLVFSDPPVNWEMNFSIENKDSVFDVERAREKNSFLVYEGKERDKQKQIPFLTNGVNSALELLPDTIGKQIFLMEGVVKNAPRLTPVHSQPVDSLLKPMMYHSDNFFCRTVPVNGQQHGAWRNER